MSLFLNTYRGVDRMKKILVLFLTIYMGIISFSQIDDRLGALNKEEEAKLEKRVEEVSEATDLNFYVNYFKGEDTLQLKEVQKSVIINLQRVDDNNLKVSLNFTQDIDIEEYRGEIENILDNLEEILNEGKNLEYSMELLGSLEEVLLKAKKADEEKKKSFSEQGNNTGKIIFLIAFLGGVYYLKRKKIKFKR